MPKIVILNVGQRFGKWTLVAEAPMHIARSGRTEKQWHCRCDCGTERVIRQSALRRGNTTNCGCYRVDDGEQIASRLIGRTFGRLTIIDEAPRYIRANGKPRRQWRCRCKCGNEVVTVARRLTSGHTKSCGCWATERRYRHGHNATHRRSATYQAWDAMMQRCLNENNGKFADYGGRGITVCAHWRRFENFLADMGERPPGKTIDRIDNDKGYAAANCRWATCKEQQRNRRCNHTVTFCGRLMTIAEAVELAGIERRGRRNYVYALVNDGVSIEAAIKRAGGGDPAR